jgi:hypothetical protein
LTAQVITKLLVEIIYLETTIRIAAGLVTNSVWSDWPCLLMNDWVFVMLLPSPCSSGAGRAVPTDTHRWLCYSMERFLPPRLPVEKISSLFDLTLFTIISLFVC